MVLETERIHFSTLSLYFMPIIGSTVISYTSVFQLIVLYPLKPRFVIHFDI